MKFAANLNLKEHQFFLLTLYVPTVKTSPPYVEEIHESYIAPIHESISQFNTGLYVNCKIIYVYN